MASDKILILTDDNFQSSIEASETPVLVDFWAEWCGPCKMVAPTLEELAEELDGQLKIAKFDVDANQGVPQEHGVRSIPTFIIFHKGNKLGQFVGAMGKDQFKQEIGKYVSGIA